MKRRVILVFELAVLVAHMYTITNADLDARRIIELVS